MTVARITTGARLHFGPLSVAAPAGGKFGGVGLMIDRPSIELTARIADQDEILGDSETVIRVQEFLKRIRRAILEPNDGRFEISVSQMIPAHHGFGSGTQLGLAVAKAVSLLSGEQDVTPELLAHRAGRGLRSAIGLYGFVHGGFLIDGGRSRPDQLGTLISRIEFPEDWRFVLATVNQTAGLSGEAEQSTFASQPAMPTALTAELCRIVVMELLPSVITADFDLCGESLFNFGHSVGEFFANAQGGIFSNPRMADWARLVRNGGIQGVAQTSWGPTLAALCPNQKAANQLQQDFATDSRWTDCTFMVVRPLNRGAVATISDD